MRNPQAKILTLDAAVSWRAALRGAGADLVITNGCFDLLQRGHCEHLYGARRLGDALLVLLHSDASVRGLKGPERPINLEIDRAYVLASLRAVSAVVIFSGRRCATELAALSPDVYTKGGDYTLETLDESEYAALRACDARIEFFPRARPYSTSALVARSGHLGMQVADPADPLWGVP